MENSKLGQMLACGMCILQCWGALAAMSAVSQNAISLDTRYRDKALSNASPLYSTESRGFQIIVR